MDWLVSKRKRWSSHTSCALRLGLSIWSWPGLARRGKQQVGQGFARVPGLCFGVLKCCNCGEIPHSWLERRYFDYSCQKWKPWKWRGTLEQSSHRQLQSPSLHQSNHLNHLRQQHPLYAYWIQRSEWTSKFGLGSWLSLLEVDRLSKACRPHQCRKTSQTNFPTPSLFLL